MIGLRNQSDVSDKTNFCLLFIDPSFKKNKQSSVSRGVQRQQSVRSRRRFYIVRRGTTTVRYMSGSDLSL